MEFSSYSLIHAGPELFILKFNEMCKLIIASKWKKCVASDVNDEGWLTPECSKSTSHSLSFNTVTQINVTNRGGPLHAALPRVLGASGPKPRRSPTFARHEPSAYGRRLRKAPTLALGTFQGDPGGSIAGSAIHGDPIREPAFPTN